MKSIEIDNQFFVIVDSDEKVSSVLKSFVPSTDINSVIFDTVLVKGIGLYRFIEVPLENQQLNLEKKKFVSVSVEVEAILNNIINSKKTIEKRNLTSYERDLLRTI